MAFNQLFNAATGGNPDMSVSARAGYARDKGAKVGTAVCHVLDWLDPRDGDSPKGDHCQIAVQHDIEGNNE
jgi:hypothetical protein